MNVHLTLRITSFCVANLRNSWLLRAIRRLESDYSDYNLLRPESIRVSIPAKLFCGVDKVSVFLLIWLQLIGISAGASQQDQPDRVQDLKYGTVLYEYYQGHAFEALTALNVAKKRGGIEGHKDHPLLVEGGLLLSYGMTRDARDHFESLLSEPMSESESETENSVSPNTRNQAWYFLGKVFYLEQDFTAAEQMLNKVDATLLSEHKPELFYEWLYLKGQIAQRLKSDTNEAAIRIGLLPKGNLWRVYLRYNLAVEAIESAQFESGISQLQILIDDLKNGLTDDLRDKSNINFTERRALREQALLTLGQLQLQQKLYSHALETLKKIRLDSVFSDQALFAYSVAATRLQQFALALQALNTLKQRNLFTPWLQQVPYAMGYLYEQLGRPSQALKAYQDAAQHYQNLGERLVLERQTLTEQKIIQALKLDQSNLSSDALTQDSVSLQLGNMDLANDGYGHLRLKPADFNIAALLASEPFQLALRDLHELYKLKFSLSRWAQQLDSFTLMLANREQLRAQRIAETVESLDAQKSENWLARQEVFAKKISQALKNEEFDFFINEQQIDFKVQIEGVLAKLENFPEGNEKKAFQQKIQRINAYFNWWIADRYGVNRWQVEKQLIGLTQVIDEFKLRHTRLEQEMQSNKSNGQLSSRVDDGRERLEHLGVELDKRLDQASQVLIQRVRDDLLRRETETQDYLLAAREAQARLSDALYEQAREDKE